MVAMTEIIISVAHHPFVGINKATSGYASIVLIMTPKVLKGMITKAINAKIKFANNLNHSFLSDANASV